MARPVIAKAQVELALKLGADAVAHGATGAATIRFVLKALMRHRSTAESGCALERVGFTFS